MWFFILQTKIQYFKETDTNSIVIGIGLLVVFFIVLLVSSKSSIASGTAVSTRPGSPQIKLNKGSFKRRARSLGLNKIHIKTLEYLINKYNVRYPENLLNNSPLLDTTIKKAIAEIEYQNSGENFKEAQKLSLFKIKQIIELNSKMQHPVKSSKQFIVNQTVVLSPEPGMRFPSKIISNLVDMMGVSIPVDHNGNTVKWKKWTPLSVYLWNKSGEGYAFPSKVLGYNIIRGVSCLFIQHSNNVQQAQQRRYRRKSVEKPAYFYPIKIIETGFGKKKEKKAFVEENRANLGTIIDVSSGGLCLRSSTPVSEGTLLKIVFETEKNLRIIVFGKIIRIRRLKPTGGAMHIIFTNISRKNLNKINSYVYGYQTASANSL